MVHLVRLWTPRAALLLGTLLLAACGDGEDRPRVDVIGGSGGSASVSGEEPAVTLGTTYSPTTNQDINLAIAADLRDLRALTAAAARGEPVDWAAVTALYENGKNQTQNGTVRSLRSLAGDEAQAVFPNGAAVFGRPDFIDGIIRDGLNGTGRAQGLSDNARRQLVDKGVQMLMYARTMQSLNLAKSRVESGAGNPAAAIDEAWATAVGFAESSGNRNYGLVATAAAREEDFGLGGKVAPRIEIGMIDALLAARRGDRAAFTEAYEAVRGTLNSTFYLSALRFARLLELATIESNRESQLAEGWSFFQVIRAQVAAASPTAAQTVETAFDRGAAEPFPATLTAQVYTALNEAAVLRALGIPADNQVAAPR